MWTITPSERRCAAALVALGLLLAPTFARAQEPATAPAESPAPAGPDPLDTLRERFREGMDKYKGGAFADAVVIWESIYRELGTEKGYRLAFDLGRAYDELGDHIKAADHYESYLERVAQRRAAAETLETNVERQEEVARGRLEKIGALKARIRVKAGTRQPVIVQIDNAPARVAGFTVYVEPGTHVVTFGSGKDADTRRVTVARGAVADLEPREEAPLAPPPPAEPRVEARVEHPFSPTVLWVAAGVALVSFVVPAITYANALAIKSDYDSPTTPRADKDRLASDYDSARTNAYASVAVPAVFTAACGGLALWYFLGTKEARTPVTPSANVGPNGVSLGASARF
jgi:hypothetical protein